MVPRFHRAVSRPIGKSSESLRMTAWVQGQSVSDRAKNFHLAPPTELRAGVLAPFHPSTLARPVICGRSSVLSKSLQAVSWRRTNARYVYRLCAAKAARVATVPLARLKKVGQAQQATGGDGRRSLARLASAWH